MTAQGSKSAGKIAVLGLGRMGSAMAARLAARDAEVVGWTRSGRAEAGFPTTAEPAEAVEGAHVALLALFDGRACEEVLDRIGEALGPDTIVINTGTVAPVEAAGLARRLGPRYVHAPVLGSVPAVAAGTLEILAAADPAAGALDRVQPLLRDLGTVHVVGDAATAAALKLVANNSLAGAVLALRTCLQQADALGLPRDQTLDVLELGQLGGLVARKRDYLTDAAAPPAAFTIGALAKDLGLLAAASGSPLPYAADLAETPVDAAADIAVAATVPAVGEDVLAPLRAYIRGHATGDPAHFRGAFLPTAHIEGIRDGVFVSWSVDEFCALFPGHPAADEVTRSRRIDSVDVRETVATASMTLWHGADTFTDVFLLVHGPDGAWRIANKAYHRRNA